MHSNKLTAKLSSFALTGLMILSSPGVVHANESSECVHENVTETPALDATCTTDGNYKYYHCDDCGVYLKADQTTETTVEAETIPATGHNYEGVEYQNDSTQHWRTCSVCHEDEEKENHDFGSDYEHDSEDHWQECSVCGYVTEPASHTLDENGTCTVCGYHEHTWSSEWSYDDESHWHECEGCDEVNDLAAHSFDNGVCTVCGADEPEPSDPPVDPSDPPSGGESGSGSGSSSSPSTDPSESSDPVSGGSTSSDSSSSSGSSSSGGSSSSSSSGGSSHSSSAATIASIETAATTGQTVVIEGTSISSDVVNSLIENPGVEAVMNLEVDGQSVSLILSNPVIDEPAEYYGPQNLIGIHNRGVALRECVRLGMDPVAVSEALRRDALAARNGVAPTFAVPLSDDYFFVDSNGKVILK